MHKHSNIYKSKVQTGQWLLHFYSKEPENNDFNLTEKGSMSVSVEGVADNMEMMIMGWASVIWCPCECFCFDLDFFVTSILCLFCCFSSTGEVTVFLCGFKCFQICKNFLVSTVLALYLLKRLKPYDLSCFEPLYAVWRYRCIFDFEHQIKSQISQSTECFISWEML